MAVVVMAVAAVVTAVVVEMGVMEVVIAAAVETPESVGPVPVAGKTAVTVPAMAEVKLVAVMTTVAAVAAVDHPVVEMATITPVMAARRVNTT